MGRKPGSKNKSSQKSTAAPDLQNTMRKLNKIRKKTKFQDETIDYDIKYHEIFFKGISFGWCLPINYPQIVSILFKANWNFEKARELDSFGYLKQILKKEQKSTATKKVYISRPM